MRLPYMSAWGDRFRSGTDVSDMPVHTLTEIITIPRSTPITPWSLIARRFAYAMLLMVLVATLVYIDRDGYSEPLTYIDACLLYTSDAADDCCRV